MNNKQKPIHTIRLGTIRAAIWENKSENATYYNVTLSRRYKSGEEWKNSDSFSRDDLLLVAKVADEANSWIFAHQQEEKEANE